MSCREDSATASNHSFSTSTSSSSNSYGTDSTATVIRKNALIQTSASLQHTRRSSSATCQRRKSVGNQLEAPTHNAINGAQTRSKSSSNFNLDNNAAPARSIILGRVALSAHTGGEIERAHWLEMCNNPRQVNYYCLKCSGILCVHRVKCHTICTAITPRSSAILR